MKSLLLSLVFFISCMVAWADHITGGEMYYVLKSVSGNSYTYGVTMELHMRCNSGRGFPNPAIVSIFDRGTGIRVQDVNVALTSKRFLTLTNPDPCISNPPDICFEVGVFEFEVTLVANNSGYVLASMINYRIDNIVNIQQTAGRVGALYSAEIPGSAFTATDPKNNSAHFTASDLVIVCAGNPMLYSFAAEDADGDKLRYSFCSAYNSTTVGGNGTNAFPTASPPFPQVPYSSGFSSGSPLGGQVTIDPNTGLISGIAPNAGIYVITVCVDEIRNGAVIATQRKDVQLNVANCGITAALLEKAYMLCDTSMTLHASNFSSSSLVNSYKWKVLDRNFVPIAAYSTPNVQHTFTDTGIYYLRLIINEDEICHDSSAAPVLVYPGFHADFSYQGLCLGKPTTFNDMSTSRYGVVNYWSWDFGDTTATPKSAASKNQTVAYSASGSKNVVLIVGNSVGCMDTVRNTLQVSDKPPLQFAFKDTLICKGDTLRLASAAPGAVQWSPLSNVITASGPTAWVAPATTSTFYADLNDNGCTNHDSVKVRVVSSVSLQTMPDTIVCQGDLVNLHVQSNGLKFNWSPSIALNNATLQNPSAQLNASTLFTVKASIGSCHAAGSFSVKTIPYPTAFAGNDTTICFGTTAQLNAISDGKIFQWLPTSLVANSNTTNTIAHPVNTTSFIFLAFDNKGCPKPGSDTVIVKVLPDINATVGHDTNLVVGQPLQLVATGGVRYQWNPASNLSSAVIANPVALFNETTDGIRYKVLAYNEAGCADSASILIKVFSKGRPVYVPTGFTPNNDGLNDVLRPTLVGVAHLDYFNVYNRYGEVVFTTNTVGKGWDGVLHGYPQPAGTYVWTIKVLNYDNTPIISKGTSVLIR